MEVTYIGHAAILVESGGTRILMDPWLNDPTYHGTWWHYPPLEMGVGDLPEIDYLYISHEHPDHFDPPTLKQVDKDVEVVIANFKRKRFRDRLVDIGFRNIREIEFEKDFSCNGSGLVLRLIPPDRAWDDSAIVVRDPVTTVLNVNDCHLDENTLRKVGKEFDIDLAFLTFTGASQYPNCFDFSEESRTERSLASKKAHVEEFVEWALLLNAKRVVPAAGNFALLAEDQLFMNSGVYANTPAEAVEALRRGAPHIEALQMNPGDRWSREAGLRRLKQPPDWDRRIECLEEMSREKRACTEAYFTAEPEAGPRLYERFKTHFDTLLEADPECARRIGITVWWNVTGEQAGDWYIDFSRPTDFVGRGIPAEWNLRISIPDKLVDLGVTRNAIWDDIVLSFRMRLSRRPDKYMKEFWTWFSKL